MKNKHFFKTLLLTLFATYFFVACSSDDDSSATQMSLTISSDKGNLTNQSGEHFTFTVVNQDENNVTTEATIYINEQSITGNTLAATEIGSYEVYAKIDEVKSNTITVTVSEEPIQYYQHKVLVEDLTGTWCQYCPRITKAIELTHEQTDRVISAAIHAKYGSDTSSDPYDYPQAVWAYSSNVPELQGFPFGGVNREAVWAYPEPENINQPIDLLQDRSPYGIAISSDLGSTSGTVDITFKFSENISTEVAYVVYIVEDGLINFQVDTTPYYPELDKTNSVIMDFEHNYVVRTAANNHDIVGTPIPSENTVERGEYNVSLPVEYESENVENLRVIAFVVEKEASSFGLGKVLNVQTANANTSIDFEVVD